MLIFAILIGGVGLALWNRGHIYDALIVGITQKWYQLVLEHIPAGARVLDVGVGTAAALLANREELVRRQQHWVGIDYDEQYIEHAKQLLAKESPEVQRSVEVRHISVYDYRVAGSADKFDVGYFSSSLMIMPDPVAALKHVGSLLKDDGFIIVTQTIEKPESRSPWMLKLIETIKPFAKFFLTIDFGKITTEPAFFDSVAAAGFKVELDQPIWNDGSIAGNGKSRFFKLVRSSSN